MGLSSASALEWFRLMVSSRGHSCLGKSPIAHRPDDFSACYQLWIRNDDGKEEYKLGQPWTGGNCYCAPFDNEYLENHVARPLSQGCLKSKIGKVVCSVFKFVLLGLDEFAVLEREVLLFLKAERWYYRQVQP